MLNNKRRYIYIIVLTIVMHILIKYFAKVDNLDNNFVVDLLIYLIVIFIVWEGNRFIDNWLDGKVRLIPRPAKRILAQFILAGAFTVTSSYIASQSANFFYYHLNGDMKSEYIVFAVLIPFVGFVILFSIEIGSRFFVQMRKSLIDVEKYKAESLQAQLQNLKNQINPHFLFNNLSVLSSLVYINQDKAVNFIQELSKVYRYLLDNKSYSMVTLGKELDFIKSYAYLLKIRFAEKFILDIDVAPEYKKMLLPPMALQMLVENAIKHNEISSEKKLTITIIAKDQWLTVVNNFQVRINKEESSKTGLQNIIERYGYFTNREVVVSQTADFFEVKIPLLQDTEI